MEVELKLAIPAGEVARFRRHPLLHGLKPVRRKLFSIYFDTPEFDLRRRGVALRLRRVGYHWVQTVKAEAATAGALTSRPEWEVQVTGNQPDFTALPAEALALFQGVDRARLGAIFHTEFQRTAWQLHQASGQVELALDQGDIRAAERCLPISEVELELKGGGADSLFDLVRQLLDSVALRPEPRSKAMRGYQLCGALPVGPVKANKPGLQPELTAGEAWQRMMSAAAGQLAANLPGFLEADDPEYLHQMRIAIRRLRSTVGLAKAVGMAVPPWAAELKWLLGEFNPARDWDVFATETLPAVRQALEHPGFSGLAKVVTARRAQANAEARAALLAGRGVRLLLDMERDLLRVHGSEVRSGDWARQVLERRLRQLRRSGKDFANLPPPQRHQVRIAAKRLRYAADAFAGLYGDRAQDYIRHLSHLQDMLGAANDAAVASGLLRELAPRQAGVAWAAGMVEGYLVGQATARDAQVAQAWCDFSRVKPYWRQGKPGK